MKHIIILGDGMADEPVESLGGLTPLEVADTPSMDRLAGMGRSGLLATVPPGFHPGSEIANMGVLGYDVRTSFEGRGVLEAASMGINVPEGWMAMRCNLICIADGNIKNHSAGHISTQEATELIDTLNRELGSESVKFYPGVSYRHLLLIRDADKRIECTPPHDVPGTPWQTVMIKATHHDATDTAALINDLIIKSQKILAEHPVNLVRARDGKDCANSIWPWSPGYRPSMEPMSTRFGIKNGAVISAVDLIFGIGVYAGLRPIHVEGATGLADTNYEGKARAAIDALRSGADFVFLHIEASDEAGHEGDIELKKRTIEYLDRRIVAPIMEAADTLDEPLSIAVLPDHPTPCRLRTHTSDAVPFIIYHPGETPDSVTSYSERAAADGLYGLMKSTDFIEEFLKV
ncbi:cofactor-independent phosphoglycerate mutase [Muribaculum intestinale]|uniref:Cofactor-independent phosphoglycerate mutase n=1 Tax=Muribaculum intestinale TaxID=1796646 RepID=A0A1B1S718_9BACT|nr:cofactor-independent phosphoglycerate mutase [Muribaculum intestinale]ANU62581.1 cofactor-independent phosphoglycerate mutase [Muribaculum intestinale]ASB36928.1 cofactor-independent phosphoglycerate mutase [Muribaculum intestinale]PWB03743.1 cofactor-independent phosphoglycerate mutase [Muribaculum intestinale]PWB10927.1 cofactor-independent phosphoglycerate mutase [Muribaculum intestinale]QQR10086.1 cofactor-independent phosphoglycerate mutase [Muribaculum intestinale]